MAETVFRAAEDAALPQIPVGDWVDTGFDWVTENFDPVLEAISTVSEAGVDGLTEGLLVLPPVVFAVLLAVLGGVVRSVRFGVASLLGLLLLISMRMWEPAMETLALILVATLIAVAIGIPVGIAAAKSDRVSAVVRPVLDFMQTMPALVYLIPAVVFFGIGVVPGVVMTIIFALPPGVRLTELGIRQVDPELVEAGHAFGSPPGRILRGIQLPLALPTIMAGINQVIMLALSMAVIAGFVGAGGLGGLVVTSISRLDLGLGVEAGLAVVVLAIYLDRLTSAFGQRRGPRRFPSLLSRGSTATGGAPAPGRPAASDQDALSGPAR
ncbi:proline/glycine betaine ABC transporter permease [Modestobacter marinus]|uniref:Glycine betaine/proline transport system permease protein n=1 Tax=Modestobacter marinus TaxID=477641 RepID=A0A846LE72_9ACTN|nr:ABC transporter permease subunit [Modestobacter marinus]NIH65996.1 glycine betaine/proline transport system permease protein [Modestobacter marinus]GGL68806.1 glycine/betaine ABC transporter permease [Modestobacter marinus]